MDKLSGCRETAYEGKTNDVGAKKQKEQKKQKRKQEEQKCKRKSKRNKEKSKRDVVAKSKAAKRRRKPRVLDPI